MKLRKTHRLGAPLLATLLLMTIAIPSVTAESPAAPVAVPASEVWQDGYDFASRVNAAHVLLDAKAYLHHVDLDDVDGVVIDVEINQTMPGRTYWLDGGIKRLKGYADARGHTVFWALPAQPGAWLMTDGISGEPVLEIVIEPREEMTMPVHGCRGGVWVCHRHQPPQPKSSDVTEVGWVIEQAAYSFTPHGKVATKGTYEHQVTVGSKASGGMAAAQYSAGASYTYTVEVSAEISSRGTPVVIERSVSFRKDTYDDGSAKVYAISDKHHWQVSVKNWYFVPPESAETWDVCAGSGGVMRSRTESSESSAFLEASAKAYGVGLDVTLSATGRFETQAVVSLDAPETGCRRFTVAFVGPADSSNGMLGMVWSE